MARIRPARVKAYAPGGYESGSGSLESAATREGSVMSGVEVFQGDVLETYGVECGREFLTPSPTGPLDAAGFFDGPFETAGVGAGVA